MNEIMQIRELKTSDDKLLYRVSTYLTINLISMTDATEDNDEILAI